MNTPPPPSSPVTEGNQQNSSRFKCKEDDTDLAIKHLIAAHIHESTVTLQTILNTQTDLDQHVDTLVDMNRKVSDMHSQAAITNMSMFEMLDKIHMSLKTMEQSTNIALQCKLFNLRIMLYTCMSVCVLIMLCCAYTIWRNTLDVHMSLAHVQTDCMLLMNYINVIWVYCTSTVHSLLHEYVFTDNKEYFVDGNQLSIDNYTDTNYYSSIISMTAVLTGSTFLHGYTGW